MATERIPMSAVLPLLLAGWSPFRDAWDRLALPPGPAPFPEAKRILSRFGRLCFGDRSERVVLDPAAAIEDDPDLLRRCEAAMGRRLYPLGHQQHQDREPIFVDERGAIYVNVGDDLHLLAKSFEASLRYLTRPGSFRDFDALFGRAGDEPRRWNVGEPAT
jgi:hypothetical protein